ncbi:ATP-binding cassette domain-containing protein [Williamwhitmania taraxaci]|uniref:ABC-type multidrug transport system, ATPase component n=1 Tax=Williamwhitmania taraxaci TaxID=1640674 RepID=A0A1G6L0N2_9BACT|nr:ATP-binding cassette domain-containing protein [Williamwhitmania taraxaci]SDC36638.1 ABC-type multidrug transport system, ATPase component [Williamwhitmania taraxaci]
MNESVLNALMQLFALIANENGSTVSSRGKKIVASYLNQHIGIEHTNDYLKLFEDYFSFYQQELESIDATVGVAVEGTLVVRQAAKICEHITKSLPKTERIMVFIRLLEFIHVDGIITAQEEHFVHVVAQNFNIEAKEFENIYQFIISPFKNNIPRNQLLIVSNSDQLHVEDLEGLWVESNRPREEERKLIIRSNLEGSIFILKLETINQFLLQYFGTGNIQLNNKPLKSGVSYIIDTGNIIKVPDNEPIYFREIESALFIQPGSSSIIFSAENLNFRFKNTQNGVRDFSFWEESGQVIGVMGGSGVGKSTLLNLLNGKLEPKSGHVMVNGYDVHREHYRLEGVIGFVPQDDLLFEELTVYQNLYYNAKLCFSNFSEYKLRETVERIIRDFDLDDIRDLVVGSPLNKTISGGQRKRVNIALELMREPSVLMVDEPTSGLSSQDSVMVMDLLKAQARKGKLVIVNIHQPSSRIFKMFDKLWIFDRGGYPIYQGNPLDAIVYFKRMITQVNPTETECPYCGHVHPEQLLEIIEAKEVDREGRFTRKRRKSPQEWHALYTEHLLNKVRPKEVKRIIPKNFFNIPNIEVQMQIFFLRNLLSKISNKQYMFINLLEAPILALILGYFTKFAAGPAYVFSDNKNFPAFLFMSVVVALFLGLTVSAEEIIRDRKILERESFLNLSRFSYLNSKILYLFALSAIQMLLYVAVAGYILEIQGLLPIYWLILFTLCCFANMLGLNISAGLNSVVAIYILIPLILVPQLLLSGTIVPFDNLHRKLTDKIYVPFVGDIMVSRWAFEALAVVQFKENAYEKHFFPYELQISTAAYNTSYLIPKVQNKLDESIRLKSANNNGVGLSDRLVVIKNELTKLQVESGKPPFEYLEKLSPAEFSEDVFEEAVGYLFFLKKYYYEKADSATKQKDSVYNHLLATIGSDGFLKLKRDYHNKALADYVLNSQELEKMVEVPTQIVRKKDPIFMMPTMNWGRAQFYAPMKKFNNQYVDTVWFNIAFIWIFTLFFAVTLQFDILRRVITYFNNLRLRRTQRE